MRLWLSTRLPLLASGIPASCPIMNLTETFLRIVITSQITPALMVVAAAGGRRWWNGRLDFLAISGLNFRYPSRNANASGSKTRLKLRTFHQPTCREEGQSLAGDDLASYATRILINSLRHSMASTKRQCDTAGEGPPPKRQRRYSIREEIPRVDRKTTLLDLPAELLLEIFNQAREPAMIHTCKALHSVLPGFVKYTQALVCLAYGPRDPENPLGDCHDQLWPLPGREDAY